MTSSAASLAGPAAAFVRKVARTIQIPYVKGFNERPTTTTKDGSFYIEIYEDELKDNNGDPWTEGKGSQWVDVQTLLHKVAHFELPACLVFCRTNSETRDKNYNERRKQKQGSAGYSYPLVAPIQDPTGIYLYFETHGMLAGRVFDDIPAFFKNKNKEKPYNFVFRAPQGRKCSQLGPKHSYIPYDYFMSCFMSGVQIYTNPTNDLLQLSSMNIMRRDYTDKECDHRFLFGSATLNGTYPNLLLTAGSQNATLNGTYPNLLLTAGRQNATASGKRRKPEKETNRVLETIQEARNEEKETNRVLETIQEAHNEENGNTNQKLRPGKRTLSGHLIGGTVKRKRRKRKTRKR